jgi:hypothetical protein
VGSLLVPFLTRCAAIVQGPAQTLLASVAITVNNMTGAITLNG